tara:strand:+ start:12819 stop:14513 length:1695 start_codon:yes stop_codon:yes gene_type:complete
MGPFIAISIFYFFGLYKSLIRYSNYQSLLTIMIAGSVYTLLWFLIVLSVGIVEKPYDFLIINWMMTLFCVGGLRYVARWILIQRSKEYSCVVIYGAGSAGIQLEAAMKYNSEIKVIAFIDDDQSMHGRYIEGIKIYDPSSLSWLAEKRGASEVLVAVPSISRSKKHKLLQFLKQFPMVIRILPGLSELAQGKVSVEDLKRIKIEDLLKREVREPNKELLKKDIQNRNVLITGAGGSIGSEICRQVIRQQPNLLILFEISELALYKIEKELLETKSDVQIMAVLGNVTNKQRLKIIFDRYNVNTIYHTAAYKHVPMVEKNTLAGLRCNIFGTLACVEAAINSDVQSFIFISTDKAVRPTNIMGATKRFAELILQGLAIENKDSKVNTRISIVRFGNVLGSSGSVVPLFREQIEKGGPVTVTDPNIIRYFMTISEAAQLVIQAGSMGSAGEIFLLDMGEPIPILQLAKDMIRLSGMSIRDKNNSDGDVEIKITGLRPGEKLYEELLIDDTASTTKHEKIMMANDRGISMEKIREKLLELEEAAKEDDYIRIKQVFTDTVEDFKSSN